MTDIPMPGETRLMHDFSLTEHHVILYDTPVVFDGEKLRREINDASLLKGDVNSPGRVGVMPRSGGEVRWIESEPSHVAHTLNAYDDGSSIVLDLIRHGGPLNLGDLPAMRPILDRWTVEPAKDVIRRRPLDDRPQEFPKVNEAHSSRPHRYGYSAAANELITGAFPTNGEHHHEVLSDTLIKHDLVRGSTEVHGFPKGTAVGEASFVPEPGGTGDEDDGYLMAYVHDPDRGAADLVVLSTQDFTGPRWPASACPPGSRSATTTAGSPTTTEGFRPRSGLGAKARTRGGQQARVNVFHDREPGAGLLTPRRHRTWVHSWWRTRPRRRSRPAARLAGAPLDAHRRRAGALGRWWSPR